MTAPFASLDDFAALLSNLPARDAAAVEAARARNGQLTKARGALGRLEDLAIWVAGWQGNGRPSIKAPQVIIFAGNHGVTAQGVSAFPAEVTVQMVANFKAGGAAINQLSKTFGAEMSVHALDLDTPTAAAAMATALFGGAPEEWVGRGTGVDDAGLIHKAKVVAAGVALHAALLSDPLQVLRCLGGREIAAMAGAMARARLLGVPVILDGFIACAAGAGGGPAAPRARGPNIA